MVSPLLLRWVKDVGVFRCNLPPTLMAEGPGSFTCYCGNTGVERILEKTISRRSSRDSNSQPFDHESGALLTSNLGPSLYNVVPLYNVVCFIQATYGPMFMGSLR